MRHIAIGIFLFAASAALAEEEVKGLVLPAVSLASEHRFNGMSLTNRNPALQLSVHYWRADGYYAGIWTTNVDFLDSNNTSIELDSYAGRNFNLGNDVELKLEGMYTAFNDDEPAPTYDFFQAKVGISRIL